MSDGQQARTEGRSGGCFSGQARGTRRRLERYGCRGSNELSFGSSQTCTRCSIAFCAAFRSAPSSSGTPRKLSRPPSASGRSTSVLGRDGVVGYLLDGQQRVSTLVGTLRLPDEVDSTVDQVDWRVYCDLENRGVRPRTGRVGPSHSIFRWGACLTPPDSLRHAAASNREVDDSTRARRWLRRSGSSRQRVPRLSDPAHSHPRGGSRQCSHGLRTT